jgi:flavin-dependent dehydrogenase
VGSSADAIRRKVMTTTAPSSITLQDNAIIAIVGGGPAGSFSAIHLLKQARLHTLKVRVIVFERRRRSRNDEQETLHESYEGCPQCAGGISPRLNDALEDLGLSLPAEVVQARINSITLQGNWKHINLPVPENRKMLSVYRGALPFERKQPRHESFDSLMLDAAIDLGAELIGSRVSRMFYDLADKPVVCFQENDREVELSADFVVFAGGVNEQADPSVGRYTSTELFRMLQPDYVPPRLRKALIFELEAPHSHFEAVDGDLHFIESSVDQLQLDMCSIMPKRGYFTVTVIGKSVDEAITHKQQRQLIRDFLAVPQIRRTLPPETQLRIQCLCNPSIVVGTADMPYAHRAAAVGDMATSRQYKDGILSAHDMARDLAAVVFDRGIDLGNLKAGYKPTLQRFRRDNRFATLIFFMYRWFFTSPFLSRVIYQTYASERKSKHSFERSFSQIFWAISSGDQSYEKIAWSMLRPTTLWKILWGGVYVTARNWMGEQFFGLDWAGIGRFPTAVSLEQMQARRSEITNGRATEFECMYSILVRADPRAVLLLLGQLGEENRPYLNPRWVRIRRISGDVCQAGHRIGYNIFGGLITFSIEQKPTASENTIAYNVLEGFAHGGLLLFEVEPQSPKLCRLTINLSFDYARGKSPLSRLYWRTFRFFFPEFIHDVLWNHALCEIKQLAESIDLVSEPDISVSHTK